MPPCLRGLPSARLASPAAPDKGARHEARNGCDNRPAGFAGLGGGLPVAATAQQDYPNRPVRLISINAAGGMVDAMLRMLAERMSADLGQPVLVENRPGANGLIAAEATLRAAPDGYAILVANGTTFTVVPWLQRQLPYDPLGSFSPIGRVLISGAVLAGPGNVPFSDLPGLKAWAQRRGERLTYGSWGIGSGAHLFGEVLHKQYGIPLEHVPYRGEQAALTDLIAGRVALTFCTAFGAKPFAGAGSLKPLGVTGSQRSPIFPDLRTFSGARRRGLRPRHLRGCMGTAGPAARHRGPGQCGAPGRAGGPRSAGADARGGPGARTEFAGGADGDHRRGDAAMAGADRSGRGAAGVKASQRTGREATGGSEPC